MDATLHVSDSKGFASSFLASDPNYRNNSGPEHFTRTNGHPLTTASGHWHVGRLAAECR